MNRIIGGIIVLVISAIDCWKYLWQISKIRKYKNSKIVSRKFYIESFLAHLIIAGIFISWGQWFIVAIFATGCFTTAYACIIIWHYYPKQERGNIWQYLKDSFKGGYF